MDVHENLFLSLANCLSFNGHSVVILHGYNTYQGRGRDCEKEFHSTEAMMECITGYRWDTNPEFKCQSLLFPQTTHRRVPNQTFDLHTLLNSMSFFLSCLWNSLMSYKQTKKKVSWTTHVHLRIKIWNDKIMMAHSKSLRREEARDCVRDTFVVWCQVGWPLRDSGHSFLIC